MESNFNKFIDESESNNNLSIYSSKNNPIVSNLVDLGYDYLYSKRLVSYYLPNDLDHALDYLVENNGIIQHFFIKDSLNDLNCFICGKLKKEHLNYIDENEDKNIENEKIISLESENISINEMKEECNICEELYIKNQETILPKCHHSFCKKCWFKFLSIKINENKLTFIKCLDYECQQKLPNEFIINIVKENQNLLQKYKDFKYKLDIINDPNKKFCPYLKCSSYAERKDETIKDVKCKNNHSFCFICLNKPHGKIPCNIQIDKNLEEYAKEKFIKKCPQCGTWTEKYEGCNHITCLECNYQWCWLCNGNYNINHYTEGKCKGFQFFKPKDEYEIQLAFEGKIQLKPEDRQLDIIHYNNDNNIAIDVFHFEQINFDNIYNKHLVAFIYIFFGQIISYICVSTRDAKYLKFGNQRTIVTYFYFLSIFIIGIANFIAQIYLNILLYFLFIFFKSRLFYTYFSEMIYYLKHGNVFEGRYLEYTDVIYDIATLFFSLFFGTFFWSTAQGYDYVVYLDSPLSYCSRKIYIFCLVFTNTFLTLILYLIQIIANIIISIFYSHKHSFTRFVRESRHLIDSVIKIY